ncbi:hypothetical protein N2152v2_011236 [Parachlorella kessleri]
MAASRMLTEVVRLLRDRLATCQAGTGNSLGAAASAAAVESPAGGPERPEDFSGCSSAPAVQRRERGPRRHVQQAGQGQQPPSLGLLEQFCQDYQSYSRFMATFVPMVIKGAGLDLYREHRAALHQALLLGCRACVAALHMLSHQPSVPCSSCSDRPSAPTPRDVSRLEQRCSDAYLTQLAALGQFKESDVPLLKQEVAAAAMASSTSTASVVSDGQIAADHRLPGPLSALCFVLASRLSPHYSSLLKSSYQRLCLSPFTWQQEVAPRGVVCEWALTLLIAGLEALKPGELASLNTEERHSLSMSLLRCLDTLGKVARQERQIAGQQEMQLGRSTTQAASSWLLAGFSGLLESLCVALASLQEVTDSAASAAAPAAALSVGEPTASVEPSAFRSPGAEVVTKASIFLAASAAMHLSRALENPAAGGGWDRSLPSPALCHWRWVVNLVALGRETSAGLAAAAARLLLSNISLREDDRVAADAAAKDRLVSLLSCECGAQPLAVVSLAASTILIVLAGSLFLELDHQSKAAAPQDGSSVQRRQKLLRSVIKTCCQTVDEAADTSFASQEQMIDQNAKWMMQWNLDERIGDVQQQRSCMGMAAASLSVRQVPGGALLQAGRGKGVRAAAGDAAASGLLGQEVGPGLSSALAEQQERREPGPRLHVQQMGQGQQLSLGLLEQFFQDYQSFCRFLANLVGKTPASAEPDQYEHLRARYYQSMLLGCRACVAALQTLSQQPSVPCSACGDRIFAPQDVGSLEQLCCDAYLTQLTVLVQFKLSSARGLVDEAAAVAMGGRPCTAGAVSDSQTGAGPTLPGPLSALCFVLASRLSPRYSTLLESSYQRLCLSPFDWQREVAPCEVMCKGALALLTANLERLEQPELLALLSRDESAALSLSLVRVLDTLGRVASQQWQDALTVEGSIPAGPTVLLASLSQLLERLCVSLVSLQGATFPAGNAAASAAVSPMGNTPGSEEPPAASSAPSSAISNWRWAISLVALGTSSSVGLAALAARLLLAPIPAILLRLDDKVAADAAAKEDFISHLADLCNAHPLALVPLAASTILEVLARSFYFELGHQSIGLVPQDDGSIQPRQKLLRLVFKACCRTVDEAAGTSFAAQDQQIEGQARQLMEGLLEGQTSGQPASSASDEPGSAEVPLVALQRDVAVSAAGCWLNVRGLTGRATALSAMPWQQCDESDLGAVTNTTDSDIMSENW